MNTSSQKIKTISTLGFVIVTFLLLATPLLFVVKWVCITNPVIQKFMVMGISCFAIQSPTGLLDPATIPWSLPLKLLGLGTDLVSHLPLWLGFVVLRKIFNNYRSEIIFTNENVRYYQYLGWLFLINAFVIRPLSSMLMILLSTITNLPGHRIISIGFGTPNIEDLFWGGVVMIIAWVMLEANKLKEEQLLTI